MLSPRGVIFMVLLANIGFSGQAETGWWKTNNVECERAVAKWCISKNNLNMTLHSDVYEGKRIRVQFRFSETEKRRQSIEFSSGSDKSSLKFMLNNDHDSLECNNDIGKYYFNGYAVRSFSWPDKLLGWSDYYAQKQWKMLKDRSFLFELIPWHGEWRAYLDGNFIKAWEKMPEFTIRRSVESITVSEPELCMVKNTDVKFEMIDISHRLNSNSIDGEKLSAFSLPPNGAVFDVEDIPFKMPEKSELDNIDIGMSWFREGALPGAHPGDRGTFGGRWYGALSNNPTRIQFRVPNRQYNALYLIATSENDDNKIPEMTVQFYRAGSGFPKSFASEKIPFFTTTSSDTKCLEVKTIDGKKRSLWLLKINIDPDQFQEFSILDHVELELTKKVLPYRCYPDPAYYSTHAAGLSSGVHVFAMTLGIRPVILEFAPVNFANIFQENEKISYRVKLNNITNEEQNINMELELKSFDKSQIFSERQSVLLNGGDTKELIFSIAVKHYGWYSAILKADGDAFKRSFVYLRKRNDYGVFRDFDSDGHIFGTWPSGAHKTPSVDVGMRIMAMAGAKSCIASLTANDKADNADSDHSEELLNVMKEFGVRSYTYFGFIDFRYAGFDFPRPEFNITFDNSQKEKMREALLKKLKELEQKPSDISQPAVVRIFGEPGGIGSDRIYAEYYGEKMRELSSDEAARFKTYCQKLKLAGELLREKYPSAKILMPHGDPLFTIPFLEIPELAKLIDGVALDYALFDRIPEMQIHQCSLHRTWMFLEAWKKYKKGKPVLAIFEGPAFGPVTTGSLNAREATAFMMRATLLLSGYGIRMQFTTGGAIAPASWYGEQHYSSGTISHPGGLNPYPSYATFAMMTRHLDKMNFEKWVSTGSLSSFCYQFVDPTSKERMHSLWIMRGTCQVSFEKDVKIFDAMDNETILKKGEYLTVSDLPVFIYGAGDSPKMNWTTPEHPDSQLGKFNLKLGNLGDGTWKQVQEDEVLYTESNPEHIKRFPALMETKTVSHPKQALSVTLGKQEIDRGIMPCFTEFKPAKSIIIPGKAEYISLYVKGTSDWGRVVYVLRDAAGRKWVSVGMKNDWNCDDTQARSVFCFDDWRLLKFELPAHSPYDNYRENGTTWWGTDDKNAVVKLPLILEKVIIERRAKVMYANDLLPCSAEPVLTGDIFAEYASANDMGDEAVRLSRIEMPAPPSGKELKPIAEIAATATLPYLDILSVEQPSTHYDGTNGVFNFNLAEGAEYYDIYLSKFPDGQGAIRLGSKIKKSPANISGFIANTDFYVFIIYYNSKGEHSKPGKGLKFKLADLFGMK